MPSGPWAIFECTSSLFGMHGTHLSGSTQTAWTVFKNVIYWWYHYQISRYRSFIRQFWCVYKLHWPIWGISAPNDACGTSDDMSNDLKAWRCKPSKAVVACIRTTVRASFSFSREICRTVHQNLLSNKWGHPFLLICCYINQLFR